MDVVTENDGPTPSLVGDGVEDLCFISNLPIEGVHIPEDDAEVVLTKDGFGVGSKGTIRGAEETGFGAGDTFDLILGLCDFAVDQFIGHAIEPAVGVGVIANFMPLSHGLAKHPRVEPDAVSQDEKGGFDVPFPQNFENLGCQGGVGTIVKGQSDLFGCAISSP